jgi:hypothetical protein
MYMDGDNNNDLAKGDTGALFHTQLHFRHDMRKDSLWYILHKPLEE